MKHMASGMSVALMMAVLIQQPMKHKVVTRSLLKFPNQPMLTAFKDRLSIKRNIGV